MTEVFDTGRVIWRRGRDGGHHEVIDCAQRSPLGPPVSHCEVLHSDELHRNPRRDATGACPHRSKQPKQSAAFSAYLSCGMEAHDPTVTHSILPVYPGGLRCADDKGRKHDGLSRRPGVHPEQQDAREVVSDIPLDRHPPGSRLRSASPQDPLRHPPRLSLGLRHYPRGRPPPSHHVGLHR